MDNENQGNPRQATGVFEHLARDDLTGLIKAFAKHSKDSIASYAFISRQQPRRQGGEWNVFD